ncbi:hypothetical protein NB724_001352 [Pantoea ananatis]|uniref:hypothetical protein n=1 Tax=Pantoea TaxID=53335 RepID=UPI0006945BEE|nr:MULTISPECIES: hypothetical protein [Pantoea]MCW0316201.1 hypothetical protein [Pantoea ananatis]MCW0334341.1 hypothetical protein [Pantoea ananatis]MCW0382690.1 hypothetical protein [Pantoea ananatis]MCW0407354.1 hypothetical protein [Pantoea ananatis]MCW0427358.1 hypothetical protein [Pantoea ananatis]
MSFKKFLTLFSLAFVVGFVLFYFISLHVNFPKAPIPWAVITILLFPAGYCVQALFKLPESNEHPSLRASELRRLKPIIRIKSRRLFFLLGYYVLSALIIALGFYAIPNEKTYYIKFISFAGGMIISSLYSFFFVKDTMDEVQSFKSMLIHRTETEKVKNELIDNANKEAD